MNIKQGTKFGDYEVDTLLGEGSFGAVYGAMHIPTKTPVAMKIVMNKSIAQDQLCNEFCAYERIKRMVFPDAVVNSQIQRANKTYGCPTIHGGAMRSWSDISDEDIHRVFAAAHCFSEPSSLHRSQLGGFPTSHWCKNVGEYFILTMERLGSDLDYVMTSLPKKRFSLNTVLLLAEQLLFSIFKLHAAGIVSCDVKPENIVLGYGEKNQRSIFMLDLGIARRFWDEAINKHVPYQEYPDLNGTPRFAGFNSHCGIENSRRDDLESLAYVLMYFHRGYLPWQGIQETSYKKIEAIRKMKSEIMQSEYLGGMDVFFKDFLIYTRSLVFDDKPDYVYLLNLIHECAQRKGILQTPVSRIFDWETTTISVASPFQTQPVLNIFTAETRLIPAAPRKTLPVHRAEREHLMQLKILQNLKRV
jgi:serine/threonine protein kinase